MRDKYILFADGRSSHTLKWLKELTKYFDLYLITLNGCSKDIFEFLTKEKVFILNDKVDVNGGNVKLILKYFEIKKIVKEIKPKFINAHYLSSYGFLGSLIKREFKEIKLIQSTWGTDILITPFANKINFYIAKYALKNADLVTSDSYFMSDKIINICQKSEVMTFPFGLDEFKVTKYKKDEYLIYSNRALVENYNIEKIVKWFATLDNEYKLIIANSGELADMLKSLVSKLNLTDRVTFAGFLNKQEQELNYKKAKYYISIPKSDSTSVSLLEAMSFGCYPIVSNLPANREWVIDEFNGVFFSDDLKLPLEREDEDISLINQKIVHKKAVFSNSIKEFVKRIESI